MPNPTKAKNGKSQPRDSATDVAYVRCAVEPGMFQGELLVSIEGVDPERLGEPVRVQLLADAESVRFQGNPERGKPIGGRLRVGVVRVAKGLATIVLPQPAIPVGEAMLVEAASIE